MAKHFRYRISGDAFTFERNPASIEGEAALDGIYVIRTSVSVERLGAEATFDKYTQPTPLQEKAFGFLGASLRMSPVRRTRRSTKKPTAARCF